MKFLAPPFGVVCRNVHLFVIINFLFGVSQSYTYCSYIYSFLIWLNIIIQFHRKSKKFRQTALHLCLLTIAEN